MSLRPAKATDLRRAKPGPKGWLNAASAAAYLDFPTVEAFYQWVRRKGVACAHRGRCLLFRPEDLDAAIGAAHMRGRQ